MDLTPPSDAKPAPAAGAGWSIATRLTVLYTLSAFGILFLALAFIYWKISGDLRDQEDRGIVDEITTLRGIIGDHPDRPELLRSEVEEESAVRPFARYFARVLDEEGHVITETAGLNEVIPSTSFPAPLKVSEYLRRGKMWRTADGRSYLCQAARAQVGYTRQSRRVIQLALEVTQQEEMLSEYRHRLIVVLVAGIFGSAVVGSGIARRGLRPLEHITESVQRITATQLNERISPKAWPKELTSLATEFDDMLARLEESFSRLSQFSADIAHELRTPINNLMGEVEVALSRSRTAPEYQGVLESSLEECSRLSRLIDSLLFVARAENTEVKIQACWFDATISIQNDGEEAVEVRVSDNGHGIAAEHLPRIFDRFYRVDPSRSGHPEGTGLGLAIVKSILELHGGTVTVQSEIGKGTTFMLRFPTHASTPVA